ncbi:MAG: primosomal protein N', partial [Rhodomicrobium sp.]
MPATELSLFDLNALQSAGADLAACNTVPILLPLALSEPYTYTVPDGEELAPGTFVVVPLGPMKRLGVVWRASGSGQKPFDPKKLKAVIAALD